MQCLDFKQRLNEICEHLPVAIASVIDGYADREFVVRLRILHKQFMGKFITMIGTEVYSVENGDLYCNNCRVSSTTDLPHPKTVRHIYGDWILINKDTVFNKSTQFVHKIRDVRLSCIHKNQLYYIDAYCSGLFAFDVETLKWNFVEGTHGAILMRVVGDSMTLTRRGGESVLFGDTSGVTSNGFALYEWESCVYEIFIHSVTDGKGNVLLETKTQVFLAHGFQHLLLLHCKRGVYYILDLRSSEVTEINDPRLFYKGDPNVLFTVANDGVYVL